ncbi:MAG: hypothetical protein R3Y60_00220 [bacterium]
MFYLNYLIPCFILIVFMFALAKPKEVYNNFLVGINKGLKASLELFPYFISMVFATTLLDNSNLLSDIFDLLKVQFSELYIQGIFKPISGNASFAMLYNIFETYGVDSKEGIVASILHSSNDTALYVATLYTSICCINSAKLSICIGILLNIFTFIICLFLYTNML